MLSAKNLSFGYEGSHSLFANLSFDVSPGERLELSAPSGAGKTTLCKVLAGYLSPSAGEVYVDESPLPQKGKCPVQLIQQHPELACDPRMRMRAMLGESGAKGEELQRLSELMHIKPEWSNRYPHELSGGELQRFCIVRALAANPSYLVCDEMTTMLDALTQMQIWKAVLDEAQRTNMGLVFVSHSPALAQRIATRRVYLS